MWSSVRKPTFRDLRSRKSCSVLEFPISNLQYRVRGFQLGGSDIIFETHLGDLRQCNVRGKSHTDIFV